MPKPRVYFNYKHVDTSWGGSNSFIRYLHNRVVSGEAIEIAADINSEYDILFLNSVSLGPGRSSARKFISLREVKNIEKYGKTSVFKYLLAGKKIDKKIVLRAVSIMEHVYGMKNKLDKMIIPISNLADHVVFQSQYIYGIFRKYGYKGNRYSIIPNGTDQTIFNLKNKKLWNGREKLKIVSCTVSTRKTKNHPVIADCSLIEGTECIHVGNWPKNLKRERVKTLGILGHREISDIFKNAHVFLHPAVKDPCPNVLFEAISSGLPVIYSPKEGSSAEIVRDCGIAIQNPLKQTVDLIKNNYHKLYENIIKSHFYYSINRAAAEYIKVFQKVIGNGHDSNGINK